MFVACCFNQLVLILFLRVVCMRQLVHFSICGEGTGWFGRPGRWLVMFGVQLAPGVAWLSIPVGTVTGTPGWTWLVFSHVFFFLSPTSCVWCAIVGGTGGRWFWWGCSLRVQGGGQHQQQQQQQQDGHTGGVVVGGAGWGSGALRPRYPLNTFIPMLF